MENYEQISDTVFKKVTEEIIDIDQIELEIADLEESIKEYSPLVYPKYSSLKVKEAIDMFNKKTESDKKTLLDMKMEKEKIIQVLTQ